jgi:hypothetical protein
MSGWLLQKSFNQSQPKENAMMNRQEKWVHERNLDEIVDRLSQLLVSIMLMSVQQINEKYLPLKKRLQPKQTEKITF